MGCGAGKATKDCRCLKNEDSELHAAAGGRCHQCIRMAVLRENKKFLDEPKSVPHKKGRTEFRNVEATPLMLAVCWGDDKNVMGLLKLGADVTVEVPVTSEISDLRAAKVLECGDDREPGLANAVDYMVAFNHYAATIPSLSETPLLPETVTAMYEARDQIVGKQQVMNMLNKQLDEIQHDNREREREQVRANRAAGKGNNG